MWMLGIVAGWAAPVDRVLFVVGGGIVTQSDVAFESFFDPIDRSTIPAFEDARQPLPERLRDIAVVRHLAGDTSVFRPDAADVRVRADAFLSHWTRPDDGLRVIRDWGMDESAFLGFLYSRLVAERFVSRSLPLPAADASEADRAAWAARYAVWIVETRVRADVRVPLATDLLAPDLLAPDMKL